MKERPGHIYSISNQKGGVGKTTTTVNLAAILAAKGHRVLIVDADPQGNATSNVGVGDEQIELSLYDVLVNKEDISDAVVATKRQRLYIVPAVANLAAAEVEMIQMLAREKILQKALVPVAKYFDFVLIDTPPSLGVLTINALTAANRGVIIPVQCEYLSLEGLSQLMNTIQLIRDNLNPQLSIAGLVLTMYDGRTKLAAEVVSEVNKHFPDHVFKSIIPRNVRLSEAPSYGEDILSYSSRSVGSKAYQALAEEFLGRVNHIEG